MEVYLVGGAVRDRQLGLPVRERDWVVVGATPAVMLEQGYQPVGKDFPVFLHPQTHEEYALARTERKTGHGYTGFETCADPGITLEEDLLRRDLTINAMAETPTGELIDPCHGLDDLNNGVLRHVSPAFAEDPVRILRTARFAARFAPWGFHVAHVTNALMRSMVAAGEASHLVPERVWAELVKALQTDTPARFFQVLAGCGALAVIFPELSTALETASTGPASTHGNPAVHLPVLEQAASHGNTVAVRFAALLCDLDNQCSDGFGKSTLTTLCDRYRVPNACRDLGLLAVQQRQALQSSGTLAAAELLELFNRCDALRRGPRFDELLHVCAADAAVTQRTCPVESLQCALQAIRAVDASTLQQQGLSGKAIGAALQRLRIEALQQLAE